MQADSRGRTYEASAHYQYEESGFDSRGQGKVDIDGFTRDLMDKFIDDTTAIAQEHDQHKRQMTQKLDEFER